MTNELIQEIPHGEGPIGTTESTDPGPRRMLRLGATGLAAAAVAGVAIAGVALARTGGPADDRAGVAGAPAAVAPQIGVPLAVPAKGATPDSLSTRNSYKFQNRPQTVGTLPAGQRVKIGADHWFQTRGTQWAITQHVPGEPSYEPFGWRATVGNDNLGRPSEPGLQSSGTKAGVVFNSVFENDKAATVVYTMGDQAWYGKIYRLAEIPGWVQSSVEMKGEAETKHRRVVPKPAVFVYDKDGTLLSKFPSSARDPLAK